ncbi:hypothetical protein HMPREF1544_06182 [Mucor circinelloides 1006PhL]|uniref:Uncharacterized protein n=1 Tax=Mucor circinelloides f. circinelloides (strain 1006PhL) TaxID=1220926 RepID=S2K4C3_MUCC1|nr:hypothetical protein HMPREF1544_06182 [Mucor circinelloides 1006PhL]
MWSCVDKCFDYSSVRCITGEKCSKASADAANSVRSPSGLSRQQSGRKMDLIFKTKIDDIEIGCGECALVGGVNTTKEFQDACFKMPKVMRDMLVKIVSRSPALVNKLSISGFYIADRLLTLYILDSPVGYVSRYDAFNPVEYPVTENKIRSRMAKLLTMIFSARIIMENCRDVIDDDESDTDLGKFRSAVMEPCFVPVGTNYKKRKN